MRCSPACSGRGRSEVTTSICCPRSSRPPRCWTGRWRALLWALWSGCCTTGLYRHRRAVPHLFMLFGMAAGAMSRLTLSRNYVSMLMLNAVEMVVIDLLRYFCYLLPQKGAPFGLCCSRRSAARCSPACCAFAVYVPMAKISRKFFRALTPARKEESHGEQKSTAAPAGGAGLPAAALVQGWPAGSSCSCSL